MKSKFLIVTNVLTLVLFYMSSFKEQSELKTAAGPCNPICIDYTVNPIEGITPVTAKNMAGTYKNKQFKILTNAQVFEETRSVWFSLDKLKSFIGELESKVCAANCPQTMKLGVRVYEGSYPDFQPLITNNIKQNTGYADVDNRYSKHLTVFMVPTYFDETAYSQVDFDPRNIGSNPCRPTPLKELLLVKKDGLYGKLSPKDVEKYKRLGVTPEPPLIEKNQKINSAAVQPVPVSNKSLILSAIENQIFYAELGIGFPKNGNNGGSLPSIQAIINHGNTIPPDVDLGAAF